MKNTTRKQVALAAILLIYSLLNSVQSLAQSEQTASAPNTEIQDPWEGFNRSIFAFNDTVDVYLLEPVAKGYDYVVPGAAQRSVGNFFSNIKTPIYLVGDLISLEFDLFAEHTGRFLINTTAGVLGLFDVAKSVGLPHEPMDIGIGLGRQGVGAGPYLVLPLLGPSSLRDGFGRSVEIVLNPIFHLSSFTNLSWEESTAASFGAATLDVVNQRADLLDAVETAKEASTDYYLFVRSAYGQLRAKQISPPTEEYDFGE